jgi:hypothetical protein
MRVVLLRAGLDDVPSPVIDGDEGMDVDAGAQEGSKQRTYEKINDVLSVCSKNGLEEELRQVCKVSGRAAVCSVLCVIRKSLTLLATD